MSTKTYEAIDPTNGLVIRSATEAERDVFLAQPVKHPAFRKPVLVGSVLIDECSGPGLWFGGAGF